MYNIYIFIGKKKKGVATDTCDSAVTVWFNHYLFMKLVCHLNECLNLQYYIQVLDGDSISIWYTVCHYTVICYIFVCSNFNL